VTPISLGIFASANQSAAATSFESIATVTVGSGGAANVEFTSIPSTYTHLQIRGIAKSTSSDSDIYGRFNGDSGTNYDSHRIYGSGSSVAADSEINKSSHEKIGRCGSGTSNFSANVIDILDYTNTNKYKTVRSLFGRDSNGSGYIMFSSGLWRNTNAITSITLYPAFGTYEQYTTFALYGIKSA